MHVPRSRLVESRGFEVIERRRAVTLAHPFREAEGLSIKQIADRLGRSPATVNAYFYDTLCLAEARTVLSRAVVMFLCDVRVAHERGPPAT